jgi:hypothetical protein
MAGEIKQNNSLCRLSVSLLSCRSSGQRESIRLPYEVTPKIGSPVRCGWFNGNLLPSSVFERVISVEFLQAYSREIASLLVPIVGAIVTNL